MQLLNQLLRVAFLDDKGQVEVVGRLGNKENTPFFKDFEGRPEAVQDGPNSIKRIAS